MWPSSPASCREPQRQSYFFKGRSVTVGGQLVKEHGAIELRAGLEVELVNGEGGVEAEAEFLLRQGRPIGGPVAHYGPFVINTQAEIAQSMDDYRRRQFGGWPWPDNAPVHGLEAARFALRPGGAEERPEVRPAPVDQPLPVA